MTKSNLQFLNLLVVTICFFVSCDQPKKEKVITEQKTINHDFSKSMTFKYEDINEIIIYSFLDKSFIKNIEDDLNKEINYNNDIQLSNDFIKEKIVLKENQKQDLFRIITKDSCTVEQNGSDCYVPRHEIVFKDRRNTVIGTIEICFTCSNFKISDSFGNAKHFCLDDMRLFLWKTGIKYFINDDHKGNKTEEEYIEIKRIYNTLPKTIN